MSNRKIYYQRLNIPMCAYACMRMPMCVCVCLCVYACMPMCAQVRLSIRTCACMRVCMFYVYLIDISIILKLKPSGNFVVPSDNLPPIN